MDVASWLRVGRTRGLSLAVLLLGFHCVLASKCDCSSVCAEKASAAASAHDDDLAGAVAAARNRTAAAAAAVAPSTSRRCAEGVDGRAHIGVVVRAYAPQAALLRAMIWSLGDTQVTSG